MTNTSNFRPGNQLHRNTSYTRYKPVANYGEWTNIKVDKSGTYAIKHYTADDFKRPY